MTPELTAKRISDYLTLGFCHNTPEGQEAIANIILDATKNLSNNLHLATETERFALAQLDKIKILALRNYPNLENSGFCSIHRDSGHYNCSICYPNWIRLIDEHCKVSDELYNELLQLSGLVDPMNGRIGTRTILAELKKKLNK